MPCGSSEISLWFEIPLQGKGTPDRMAKPMNLFITSHQRRRSPCIIVSHSIFLVNYIFMLFNMDDWLQDHMVKTHCSGHRVDAGSGTDTAHAAAGTSPCLPRCCQPQTLKRPLKKTSPEPSRFRGCMHAGKENVSERFAFEHICGPGLCSRPAGFTPPSEQPQFACGCSGVAAPLAVSAWRFTDKKRR